MYRRQWAQKVLKHVFETHIPRVHSRSPVARQILIQSLTINRGIFRVCRQIFSLSLFLFHAFTQFHTLHRSDMPMPESV